MQTAETDDTFDKIRLLMTSSEIEIYKHLPDKESKELFLKDFWKKRDPTPETEENEFKIEIERRIEYASRWFKDASGMGEGWNSDRGKVYLLLGEPDDRSMSRKEIVDRFGIWKTVDVDVWVYDYYRLTLVFMHEDGMGKFILDVWPVELLDVMERAKTDMERGNEEKQRYLTFKTKYTSEGILIEIPTDKIDFMVGKNDKDNKVLANFQIKIYVYRNYKKIEEIDLTRELGDNKQYFLDNKKLSFMIPYHFASRGKYFFDIIVKDLNSGSSWRNTLRHKY